MGTVEILIITGTLIVVVAGGLAIFFWWRMQYGAWSRPSTFLERGPRRGGTVISDNFDTRQERITSPEGSRGVAHTGTLADAAERLRLIQLGTVVGIGGSGVAASHIADGAGLPGARGSDNSNDLLRGAAKPPLPPDADEHMTRPAKANYGEEMKRSSGWSTGSTFGIGGPSDSTSSSSTESSSDPTSSSASSFVTHASHDYGFSGYSDSGFSSSGGDS